MQRGRCLLLALVLLLTATLLLACDTGGSGGVDKAPKDVKSKVAQYPITFKGVGTATEYYSGGAECTRDAAVTFTVQADHTCHLLLSFPLTILTLEGKETKCVENGETKAWVLRGAFDPASQECVFSGCNDTTAYQAGGMISFGAEATTPAWDLSCKLVKNGKGAASFGVPSLHVVK